MYFEYVNKFTLIFTFIRLMFAQKGLFILEFYFGGGLFLVCIAYLMQKKSFSFEFSSF